MPYRLRTVYAIDGKILCRGHEKLKKKIVSREAERSPMKKAGVLVCIAVLVITAGVSLGCGGGGGSSKSPKEVADEYMQATINLDVDAAWELMSEADQQSITKEQMAEMAGTELENLEMSYVLGEETINGDDATVEVTLTVKEKTSGQSQEMTDVLNLVKENGEWKVTSGTSP